MLKQRKHQTRMKNGENEKWKYHYVFMQATIHDAGLVPAGIPLFEGRDEHMFL
jgi:hypothetical protein